MISPRTAILVRIYLTLVSVSLVLIAIHVYRHFPALFARRDPVTLSIVTSPHEQTPTHAPGPTINWGGQKH
jgi:hypothetical protein